ncbi:hypothetical protein EZS27_024397 [termite gut metagenome]|uniref:DNA pilot protein n=1 Tax=termite gut metagenome TaxID=433724 RepID=A0A5J4QZ36_9ZZZZ
MSILGGLGAGLLSVGGAVAGSLFNSSSQKSANETNLKLAQQQRDFEQKMWEQNNEYNLPSNQMSRFTAAGLNKNLIYGKITDNVAAPAPRGLPGHIEPFLGHNLGMNEGVDSYFNSRLKDAQTQNMYEQNENLQAQNNLIKSQTAVANASAVESGLRQAGMLSQNVLHKVNADWAPRLAEQSYEVAQQNMRNVAAEIEQKHANTQVSKMQLVNILTDTQLKQFELQLNKLGLQRNDALPFRVVATLFRKLFPNLEKDLYEIIHADSSTVVKDHFPGLCSPSYPPRQK